MQLASRTTVARPARSGVRSAARVTPARVVFMRAQPEKVLQEAIKEAEQACEGGATGECAAAWDNVEEISAAISHKKAAEAVNKTNDPLEQFCGDNPDADECRVYDD